MEKITFFSYLKEAKFLFNFPSKKLRAALTYFFSMSSPEMDIERGDDRRRRIIRFAKIRVNRKRYIYDLTYFFHYR